MTAEILNDVFGLVYSTGLLFCALAVVLFILYLHPYAENSQHHVYVFLEDLLILEKFISKGLFLYV